MNADIRTVCDKDMCTGCMLCVDMCPVNAIFLRDSLESYNAIIELDICLKCGKCHKLCPQNSSHNYVEPSAWYEGWSRNPTVRVNSASGGMASEISTKFIQLGGEVCTCVFDNGEFIFKFIDKVEDVLFASGSKYVKSNPHGIYKDLLDKLANGKKILMIGLPCQIAAAKKYTNHLHEKNFYTIDLICHGTPSPELLRLYLKGNHIILEDIQYIRFRKKNNTVSEYKSVEKSKLQERIQDEYMHAFDIGMSCTKNCHSCHYARLERLSDITLGDSWGSELSQSEKEKGISLILCQTMKGKELLNISDAELLPVDVERAINSNPNLRVPSEMPSSGYKFFDEIKRGKSFHRAMMNSDLRWTIKHRVKTLFPWMITIKQKIQGAINNNSVQYQISIKSRIQ